MIDGVLCGDFGSAFRCLPFMMLTFCTTGLCSASFVHAVLSYSLTHDIYVIDVLKT